MADLLPLSVRRFARLLLAALLVAGLLAAQTPPQPGELAPDFELKVRGADRYLRLSDFRGAKPVALVFGSFT